MNTNIVILEGRLTRDPETKEIGTNNTQVTNFGMAVNRPQKRGDEWIDNTGFYEVQAWQRNAELAMQLSKGDAVIVVGDLRYETWEKDGQKRNAVRVNAATIGRQLMKPTDGAKKSVADDDDIPF
jgi:single-strand DNA-binding protein